MPRLLTVTGGRIDLELDRRYVLGRSRDCDVVVEDMGCSRRHACLTVGPAPEILTLEDLGSRNGTHVNDALIEGPTPLEHGSRIQLGATIFLVSLLENDAAKEEAMLDTGTVALEGLGRGRSLDERLLRVVAGGQGNSDLAGQLGSFSVIEVLQILNQTGRSGTLHVATVRGRAEVEVRAGEIKSARYEELEGFPALLMLARRNEGVFWLVKHKRPCQDTVRMPASRLLFELCRSLDERPVERAGPKPRP